MLRKLVCSPTCVACEACGSCGASTAGAASEACGKEFSGLRFQAFWQNYRKYCLVLSLFSCDPCGQNRKLGALQKKCTHLMTPSLQWPQLCQ